MNRHHKLYALITACTLWLSFAHLYGQSVDGQQPAPPHRLFSDSLRSLRPLPVYDFLENALAEQDSLRPDRELMLRKVVFTVGSWKTLRKVTPADDCSISNIDGHHYIVSWKRAGRELVSLYFPIDYELLAGSTRRKMERSFVEGLSTFVPDTLDALPDVPFDALRLVEGDSIYVLEGDTFQKLPGFASHTFYTLKTVTEQDTDDDGHLYTFIDHQPELVTDSLHPRETLANWLLSASSLVPDALLTLEFRMSDCSRVIMNTQLRQFMQYCRQQGCRPYYIYKKAAKEQEQMASLLLHNAASGYAHLVKFSCQQSQFVAEKPELTGRVSMYLPFAQVSAFSSSPPKGKSTPKHYK